MKLNKNKRLLVLFSSAGLIAAAAGFGAVAVPDRGGAATAADPDVAGLLRERSPGVRLAGAETSKNAPVPITAITPISAPRPQVLGERDAGPVKIAMLPPAVVPPAPAPAIGAAPVPPSAIAPVAGAAVAIPVVAAASSGPGLAALLPIIPAAFAIGGGGGGGAGGASIAPAVPEPQTWMMMITGFGLLGLALRRRRREDRARFRAALLSA